MGQHPVTQVEDMRRGRQTFAQHSLRRAPNLVHIRSFYHQLRIEVALQYLSGQSGGGLLQRGVVTDGNCLGDFPHGFQ